MKPARQFVAVLLLIIGGCGTPFLAILIPSASFDGTWRLITDPECPGSQCSGIWYDQTHYVDVFAGHLASSPKSGFSPKITNSITVFSTQTAVVWDADFLFHNTFQIHVKLDGQLKDDGTLQGTLTATHSYTQNMPFKLVRVPG